LMSKVLVLESSQDQAANSPPLRLSPQIPNRQIAA